ncbi:MAG: DsrE family protein [Gemmatimonadota bacterium]
MGKTLVILNDPPYGTERSYNGLRLAGELAKREGEQVRVFLIGDGVSCANRGQTVPKGYYNIESMLKAVSLHNGEIGVCGSCMDARGILEDHLAADCRRSTIDVMTDWTLWADRVAVF